VPRIKINIREKEGKITKKEREKGRKIERKEARKEERKERERRCTFPLTVIVC
jgi:hypothetical protein